MLRVHCCGVLLQVCPCFQPALYWIGVCVCVSLIVAGVAWEGCSLGGGQTPFLGNVLWSCWGSSSSAGSSLLFSPLALRW